VNSEQTGARPRAFALSIHFLKHMFFWAIHGSTIEMNRLGQDETQNTRIGARNWFWWLITQLQHSNTVSFHTYSQGASQIAVKLRYTLRHSTCASTFRPKWMGKQSKMSAKLILAVHDSVTAHQLSLFSVCFNTYSQRFPQIVTAAVLVKLRHTLRHSTCVSTRFGIIGRHKILCDKQPSRVYAFLRRLFIQVWNSLTLNEDFFFGSDPEKLAKLSYQTVLERVLGIRNHSSPVLRLSHSSVW